MPEQDGLNTPRSYSHAPLLNSEYTVWIKNGYCELESGFGVVSMTMIPVTSSSGCTVPVPGELRHLKVTVSQLCQMLRIANGIGAWPLWPMMNAFREEKVAAPSVAAPVGHPLLMSSLTESEKSMKVVANVCLTKLLENGWFIVALKLLATVWASESLRQWPYHLVLSLERRGVAEALRASVEVRRTERPYILKVFGGQCSRRCKCTSDCVLKRR